MCVLACPYSGRTSARRCNCPLDETDVSRFREIKHYARGREDFVSCGGEVDRRTKLYVRKVHRRSRPLVESAIHHSAEGTSGTSPRNVESGSSPVDTRSPVKHRRILYGSTDIGRRTR